MLATNIDHNFVIILTRCNGSEYARNSYNEIPKDKREKKILGSAQFISPPQSKQAKTLPFLPAILVCAPTFEICAPLSCNYFKVYLPTLIFFFGMQFSHHLSLIMLMGSC